MRALWSDRHNCSHNVSQKVKRIRSSSDNSCKMATISRHLSPPISRWGKNGFIWGFPKGGFCEGGKSQYLGWVRAPVAIINFAFFVRELLIESYINSEIFTGI